MFDKEKFSRTYIFGVLLCVLEAVYLSAAMAGQVGIASGQPSGTNFAMANDIAKTCSTATSPITNIQSDGSLDNLQKVYGDKNTQYGIVQTDALVYQQGQDPKMMDRIQMVFPFFSSEIHLIVRADSPINSLAQLQGKRVDEDVEGSGSWVSVQVIKALTGMTWTSANLQQAQGLQAVQSGQVDAMFVNAGRPVDMLTRASGIKLVSISNPKLDGFALYTKSMIPSGSYPFQKSGVQTYKTDNVLVTYAFKNQYQKEIGDLVTCITRNLPNLQANGHPKWRDVDPLDIDRIKWQSHPAAVAAIKRESHK
jgi:TRAP transporter TAXI family solute receptor